MSESVAVVPASRPSEAGPLSLIHAAIDKGIADPAVLEKLVALEERVQANRAADEYAAAVAAFQAECPPIYKQNAVRNKGGGSVRYKFAAFEDIMRVAGPVLARHGISLMFTESLSDGLLTVTMRVRVGRHYEDKAKVAPLPDLGRIASAMSMTEPQAFGFVLSYFKRYCLTDGLNLVVVNEDTDANPVDVIDPKWQPRPADDRPRDVPRLDIHQARRVSDLLARSGRDVNRFLAWVTDNARRVEGKDFPAVTAVGQIPAEAYQLVVETLERAVAQKGGGS